MSGPGLFLLIVAGLFGYVWLVVRIAKPRPIAKPIKDSKAWLIAQTVIAWPFALFFGLKTFGMLAPNSNLYRQFISPNPGKPPYSAALVAGMWFGYFCMPLFFALGVRWTRSVMRKWKALRLPPAEEACSATQFTDSSRLACRKE